MTAKVIPQGKQQYFASGTSIPLSGGKLWTYAAGTSTPKQTWSDSAQVTPNANPIILDSRGEATIYWNGNYKVVLMDSADTLIWSVDNVSSELMIGEVTTAMLADEAVTTAKILTLVASKVTHTPAGTGAVATDVQTELRRQKPNVLNYGADATGTEDSTAAFVLARTVSPSIYIPPGTFKLDNYRPVSGEKWECAGYENTIIQQGAAGNPAINCLSDVSSGQLSSVSLKGFKVVGHATATVAPVLVAAYGVWAIWKSEFDFVASQTYKPFEVQGADANNVFKCDFRVTSQDSDVPVLINGGTYNSFDLFLTNTANGRALDFTGQSCFFQKAVADGQLIFRGNATVINNATVEQIYGTAIAEPAIKSLGFNETFINPAVILDATSAAKVSEAFSNFQGTTFINPKVLAATLANPFAASNDQEFTIIGPGQSTTTNKMDTLFVDNDGSTLTNLRRVNFVGDCSEFVTVNTPMAGRGVQYLAPTTDFNFVVKNNTSQVLFEPTGVIAVCNLNLPYIPSDGQTVSFSTTQTITTLNIGSALPAGVDVSLVPTTITAAAPFTVLYKASTNKWYPVK